MGVAVGASRAFCLDDIAATSTRQSVSYFNVHVVPARVEASVVAMVMVMIGVRMVIFHGGAYAAGRGVGESVAKSARCSPHHLTTKNGLGLATERH